MIDRAQGLIKQVGATNVAKPAMKLSFNQVNCNGGNALS